MLTQMRKKSIIAFCFVVVAAICLDLVAILSNSRKMYVDVEISEDGNLTLFSAHKIAEQVHDSVEGAFDDVKHCMVHVNPAQE